MFPQQEDSLSIVEIFASFDERKRTVKALDMSLAKTTFYSKGGMSYLFTARGTSIMATRGFGPEPYPPQDVEVEASQRLVLSGDSMRLEAIGTNLGFGDEGKAELERFQVFHEGSFKELNNGIGKIANSNDITQFPEANILMAFLDLESTGVINRATAAILRTQPQGDLAETVVIGNADYDPGRPMNHSRYEWYLDRKRDFLPVKLVVMKPGGEVVRETDIEYQVVENVGYIPISVATRRMEFDRLYFSEQIAVTRYAVNEPVDPSLFDLEFPPGTHVQDATRNTEFVAGRPADDRLLQELREDLAQEVSAEESTLDTVASDNGPAATVVKTTAQDNVPAPDSPPLRPSGKWWILGSVAALLAGGLAVVWRRARAA